MCKFTEEIYKYGTFSIRAINNVMLFETLEVYYSRKPFMITLSIKFLRNSFQTTCMKNKHLLLFLI